MATQRMTCHGRSNSLPSRPHPLDASIEDQLQRLKSCNEASSSSLLICQNLSAIKDLYEDLNVLIQLPKNQIVLFNGVEEILEGSLVFLDICGSTMDVLLQVTDFISELKLSLRRKNDIGGYLISRKIIKMISKCFENLNKEEKKMLKDGSNDNSSLVRMLNEAEALCLSTLKSVLGNVLGTKVPSKGQGWLAVANLIKSKHVSSQEESSAFKKIDSTLKARSSSIDMLAQLKQLEELETDMIEMKDGVESISRNLVKARVSLLNVHNH